MIAPALAPPLGQLAPVQMLRAVAALAVAFAHTQHHAAAAAAKAGAGFAGSHILPWDAGVDLFFIISGFIMVHASAGLAGQPGAGKVFLLRRLVRIVPLYWLCLSAYLVLAGLFAAGGPALPLGTGNVLASYLFWPRDVFGDGHARPLYDLGWTLNYEMLFYAIFALGLTLPRRLALPAIVLALGALVLLGQLVQGLPVPLRFWSQPIVLEFVLGMALAQAHAQGLRLARPVALGLVLLGLGLLMVDPAGLMAKPEGSILPNDARRLLGWGLPAAMIFAGLVLGHGPAGQPGPVQRFAVALGDASYALYLTHPFVIVAWRKLWFGMGLQASLGVWAFMASSLVLATGVALLTFRLFERPLTRALTARLAPPPGAPRG